MFCKKKKLKTLGVGIMYMLYNINVIDIGILQYFIHHNHNVEALF